MTPAQGELSLVYIASSWRPPKQGAASDRLSVYGFLSIYKFSPILSNSSSVLVGNERRIGVVKRVKVDARPERLEKV